MSNLHQILTDYLATRRAMGYKLQHADRRLLEFVESVPVSYTHLTLPTN